MAHRIPDVNGAAIVLTGSFNPAIFQPAWFAQQNLLPQTEADTAEVKAIIPQFCHFETGRFHIQVTNDRFAAIAKPDANPAPLKDLVLGTFYILEHTPLTALGLNRFMHFSMQKGEDWHRVGDKLAPKDGWRGIMKGHVGLRSLVIQNEWDPAEGPTALPEGATLTIKVEPSSQVNYGVYFETNENHPGPKTDSLRFLTEVIRTRWEESYNYAHDVADRILSWAAK
jgi:hypothetical protein